MNRKTMPPRSALRMRWIEPAQLVGGPLRQDSIEVDLLDAVGLAALLDDREDLDVPVKIFVDGAPVRSQFTFGMDRVRSCVQHHMVGLGDLPQAAQGSP